MKYYPIAIYVLVLTVIPLHHGAAPVKVTAPKTFHNIDHCLISAKDMAQTIIDDGAAKEVKWQCRVQWGT